MVWIWSEIRPCDDKGLNFGIETKRPSEMSGIEKKEKKKSHCMYSETMDVVLHTAIEDVVRRVEAIGFTNNQEKHTWETVELGTGPWTTGLHQYNATIELVARNGLDESILARHMYLEQCFESRDHVAKFIKGVVDWIVYNEKIGLAFLRTNGYAFLYPMCIA
ncbi:uncharacterized protein LOC132306115 [Cornus florida]|uniref:uncharacterized protein LOC132306115 n=1 Tax=Cornus florida TaxID=4283 RepID=UPI00289B6B07|nr:uncharacterized protein LOC132306115 [Cornus florida]